MTAGGHGHEFRVSRSYSQAGSHDDKLETGSPECQSRGTSTTEFAVPVHMELRRIVINEVDDLQVIVLKEVEGNRSFPIVIRNSRGHQHRSKRVKGMPSPRPLTHDLVTQIVELMGGEIQDIVISDLKEHTYFAKLRVRKDGELIEVDCRPSDAIALAVTRRKCRSTLPRTCWVKPLDED